LAFDYPTVEAIVDYLVKEVLGIEFTKAEVAPEVIQRPEDDLEGLSQAETAALLAQELAAIDKWKAL
jgi:hypothetical protein